MENQNGFFTMEDFEIFEKEFNQYISILPELMEKHNVFPTVSNIKQHLIDYINCQDNMPDNLKIDLGQFIKTETTFCNLISDVNESVNVNEMIKYVEPLDIDKIKLKDDELMREKKNRELKLDDILH